MTYGLTDTFTAFSLAQRQGGKNLSVTRLILHILLYVCKTEVFCNYGNLLNWIAHKNTKINIPRLWCNRKWNLLQNLGSAGCSDVNVGNTYVHSLYFNSLLYPGSYKYFWIYISSFLKKCRTSGIHQIPVKALEGRLSLTITTLCPEFYSNNMQVSCSRTSRCFEKSINSGEGIHSWKSQTVHR